MKPLLCRDLKLTDTVKKIDNLPFLTKYYIFRGKLLILLYDGLMNGAI